MATRQERLAARRKRIEAKATTIIAEATAKVVAKRPSPTPAPSQDPTPQAVKAMRDGGASWMEVGKHFGLPGAKYGAGRARQLYAAANSGVLPRSYAPRKGTIPKPQTPGSTGTITSRKTQLVEQGHVIPRDMPDEEVEALVRGRTIVWAIDLAMLCHRLNGSPVEEWPIEERYREEEARVHVDEQWIYCGEEDSEGNRVLRFREYAGRDDRGNHMSGPTRTVRVDSIFTIR